MKNPRDLSLVKFTLSKKFGKFYEEAYPFKSDRTYLFLGEIPNMPGHCVVMDFKAKLDKPLLHVGYHTDDFEELSKEEV